MGSAKVTLPFLSANVTAPVASDTVAFSVAVLSVASPFFCLSYQAAAGPWKATAIRLGEIDTESSGLLRTCIMIGHHLQPHGARGPAAGEPARRRAGAARWAIGQRRARPELREILAGGRP